MRLGKTRGVNPIITQEDIDERFDPDTLGQSLSLGHRWWWSVIFILIPHEKVYKVENLQESLESQPKITECLAAL